MPIRRVSHDGDRPHQLGGSGGFLRDVRKTSVPLDGGGDTHMHLAGGAKRVVVTTRLRGGVDEHDTIDVRDCVSPNRSRDPAAHDMSEAAGSAFRSVFGDDNDARGEFNPTEGAAEAFRSLFGDDND